MKSTDVILSVLTLTAIGMGVAVYRVYFPSADVVPEPVAAPSVPTVQPVAAADATQMAIDFQASLDSARALGENQRCVAGTVVTVRGSVYTQEIGADAKPVTCRGRLADSPLRPFEMLR